MNHIKIFVLTAFVFLLPISVWSKKNRTVKLSDKPIFTNVEYFGEDSVYINNPLGEGEFYNPILQVVSGPVYLSKRW